MPYYPTRSPEEYRGKYPNAGVTLELKQKHLHLLPASKWGKEHLIACRLIQNTGGKILPVLKEFAPEPNDLEEHKEWDNIKRLVDGPQKQDLMYKSSLELDQENGNLGLLWSMLAECMALRQPSQKSYLASSSNGEGVYNGEHTDRTEPDVLTAKLAGAFIRYVLNFCAGQEPRNEAMLEFREDPERVRHDLPLLRLDATDDGGIWTVETREWNKYPWMFVRRLALLDAKKAFQCIDDDNQPVVSDAHLSQYTCEALTACLNYPYEDEVFVVAITHTFMRFLHFHRTKDYMEYLYCTDAEQQRASNAYLHMTETEFFALDSEVGRDRKSVV